MRIRLVVLLGLGLGLTVSGSVHAQSSKAKPEKRAAATKRGSALTPEREAAVMTFVKLNHPDLEMLLIHLKQSEPKEYEKAVRDLTRVIDRLAASKERDSEVYDLELRSWKAQSRLQLLSARQAMGASEDLREQMREVISEQGEVRAEMLRREKQRIQERLSKIDSELNRLEKSRDRWIDQQLKTIAGPPATDSAKPSEVKTTESRSADLKPASTKPAASSTAADSRSKETGKKKNKPNKP